MNDLFLRMKRSRAKSNSHVCLFEHSCGVLKIVDHMIRVTPDYPLQLATVLRLGAFLHDIGKMHPEFQVMLNNRPPEGRWIKHEAQTYRFAGEIYAQLSELAEWIGNELDCETDLPDDCADILAFAVTHHGVFYSSLENGSWHARREWTKAELTEERRITLADLLIRYYPLGGTVIFADMLHSYQLSGGGQVERIFETSSRHEWKQYIAEHRNHLLEIKDADRSARLPHDLLDLLLV